MAIPGNPSTMSTPTYPSSTPGKITHFSPHIFTSDALSDAEFEELLAAPSALLDLSQGVANTMVVKKRLDQLRELKEIDISNALDIEPDNSLPLRNKIFTAQDSNDPDYNGLKSASVARVIRVESLDGAEFTKDIQPTVSKGTTSEEKVSVFKKRLRSNRLANKVRKIYEMDDLRTITSRARLLGQVSKNDDDEEIKRPVEMESEESRGMSLLRIANSSWRSFLSFIDISGHIVKRVEKKYGSAVASYFVMLKDLVVMNFVVMILFMAFIILPNLLNNSTTPADSYIDTCRNEGNADVECIFKGFVISVFTGEGYFENTLLFIGNYGSGYVSVENSSATYGYHVPSAYLYTYFFFLILVAIFLAYWLGGTLLKNFSGLRQELGIRFGGHVFSACNFNLGTTKAVEASYLANSIHFKELYDECIQNQQKRTKMLELLLFFWRVVTWSLVLILLIAGVVVILANPLCNIISDWEEQCRYSEDWRVLITPILVLLVQQVLDVIFPIITRIEFYQHKTTELYISLNRLVLVRVSSIAAIILDLFYVYSTRNEKNVACWETEFGQTLYQQIVVSFVAAIVGSFILLAIRRLISYVFLSEIKSWNCLPSPFKKIIVTFLDGPTFKIPTRIMVIIYLQTLAWLGVYFSPWISVIAFIGFLFTYISLLFATLLFVKFDPTQVYYSARSFFYYNLVLVCMFFYVILLMVWPIFSFTPSNDCTPFRGQPTAYSLFAMQLMDAANRTAIKQQFEWIVPQFYNSPMVVPTLAVVIIIIVFLIQALILKKREVSQLQRRLLKEQTDKVYYLNLARDLLRKYRNSKK